MINDIYGGFTLNKPQNKDYKILQLTDIQVIDVNQLPYEGRLSEAQIKQWSDRDKCAFDLVKELVKETEPDYIVVTGDNVYGQFDDNGSAFISFVELMESFGIPWSFVNGNHDGETFSRKGNELVPAGKGMRWQAEYVKNNTKYCLFDSGDEKMGYGNYFVKLVENGKTFYSFTFLDSHGCDGKEPLSINAEQTAFYINGIESINNEAGKTVPNFLFFHIPMKQFRLALYSLSNGQDIYEIAPIGKTDENGNFGTHKERMINVIDNDILWRKIKELKSTKGIFVGHDHINNSSIIYEGIRLTFGTKTGTFDYHDQNGGTLITIKSDGSFTVNHILK